MLPHLPIFVPIRQPNALAIALPIPDTFPGTALPDALPDALSSVIQARLRMHLHLCMTNHTQSLDPCHEKMRHTLQHVLNVGNEHRPDQLARLHAR